MNPGNCGEANLMVHVLRWFGSGAEVVIGIQKIRYPKYKIRKQVILACPLALLLENNTIKKPGGHAYRISNVET